MERKTTPTRFEIQAKERLHWLIDNYCDGSQQNLSDCTGVGKASISQYVNGKNIPSSITAKKLCAPFHINPAWLMGFDVAMSDSVSSATSTQRTLTPDESALLDDYKKLNMEGKAEARKQVKNFTKIEDYTKDTGSSERKMA